jgi:hypothetical protein
LIEDGLQQGHEYLPMSCSGKNPAELPNHLRVPVGNVPHVHKILPFCNH